ncbi:DUF3427 domain-containing protein [Weissella confusa]|uniref:DUF3427 domain-containing protein n=1 Tax=Weissella confusa TaxID=1583 RepID=UPI0035A31491
MADGLEFYYLGSAKVLQAEEMIGKDKEGKDSNLIRFEIRLEKPVDPSLYRALVEDVDAEN